MIAVCLLTCDRPELTAITVSSFVEFNRPRFSEMWLLHADGGSQTNANGLIAAAAGFHSLVDPGPEHRLTQMDTFRIFVTTALGLDAEWMFWLENDWESVAPLPSEDFLRQAKERGVDTIRLFGTHKFRTGPRAPAGPHRIGTREVVEWTPAMDGWEMGRTHWGAGGTLVRTEVAARQLHRCDLKRVIEADIHLVTLRPVNNRMWSIGYESTVGVLR